MQPRSLEFWAEFGISPEGAKRRNDFAKLHESAKKAVRKLSVTDLRKICEAFEMALPEGADRAALAKSLLAMLPESDLLGLHLFSKQKVPAIRWTAQNYPKLRKLLKGLSAAKPMTVLLIALAKLPECLREIFYYAAWNGTTTTARFLPQDLSTQSELPKLIASASMRKLEGFLSKASGIGCSVVGSHQVSGGLPVFYLNRHYAPTIAKDYVDQFTVRHGCGSLLLGYSLEDGTLHVKGGNAQLIDAIETFFERELAYPLQRTDVLTVPTGDYEKFQGAVFRGETINDEFRLVGLALHRNSLTGQPLEIPLSEDFPCIASTIQKLHETTFTSGLSLLDVNYFSVVYQDQKYHVATKLLPKGAIVLTYDNRGIDRDSQQNFEAAVVKYLGITLHRQISPVDFPNGKLPVISFLLRSNRKTNIETFQKALYRSMLDGEFLQPSSRSVLKCANSLCRSKPISATENSKAYCQLCGGDMQLVDVELIERSPAKIMETFESHLEKSDEWFMRPLEKTFEGIKYYELEHLGDNPLDSIVFLEAAKMTEATRQKLERLGKAIILLDDGLVRTPSEVDANGIGHLSTPWLIHDVLESTTNIKEALSQLLADVSRSHRERVLRASRTSHARLRDHQCASGDEFEIEAYNLLRIIFPNSIRLGRKAKIEPDGLIQIQSVASTNGDELIPTGFIGYDAKFNLDGKGYKLPIGERRKVRDYIKRYQRAKPKIGPFRDIVAHAFVSNNMSESQVAKTVRFLRSKDGLGKDLRCILMSQPFIITMYDLIESNSAEFGSRRQRFEEHFYNLAMRPNGDYVPMDDEVARWLFAKTMADPPSIERLSQKDAERIFDEVDYDEVAVPKYSVA